MSYQCLFLKLKDVVPVQVLNILKEYLLIKTFKVTLIYVLIIVCFKLIRDVTMFPEIEFSDKSIEKILSIRVLECEVI